MGTATAPAIARPAVGTTTAPAATRPAVGTTTAPAAARPARRARRGPDAVSEVLELAGRLQMLGPLGIEFSCGAGACGGAFAADLERTARLRCAEAWDLPRVRTMLTWVEPFLLVTGRVPWVPALELPGQVHNRMTLDLLREFIFRSPPMCKAKGDHVSADAASSYVSVAYTLRCREARYDVAPAYVDMNGPLAVKSMRKAGAPRGERNLSRGLLAVHMLSAAQAGFDRSSTEQAIINWAVAIAAHNLLLRGGEVGVPDGIEPDPRRIITFASIVWMQARGESQWRLWLIIWVVPIKDANGTKRGYPCPVARRHDGPLGTDALCAYDAIALAYWVRRGGSRASFPVDAAGRPAERWHERATRRDGRAADEAPFFTVHGGFPYSTSDTRRLAQRVAEAAGEPPDEFGGKAFRVGGSTDYRAELGFESGRSVIQQRGRWDTDVNEVYQRPLIEEQLRGSAAVGSARGVGLEDVCRGFAQRATRG